MKPIDLPADASNIRSASIFIVGYDLATRRMLTSYLNRDLETSCVLGARELLRRLRIAEPDLIVLDPDLEEIDGLELLREVRQKSAVPIIFVSDRDGEETERVVGLELGADDFMMGPLSLPELRARIRAKLRRRLMGRANSSRRRGCRYTFEGWILDQRKRHVLSPEGEHIRLSKREFALLSAFVEAPWQTLSRAHLLSVTRRHEDVFDRSIDVQVFRLRRKLRDNPQTLIRTARGVGYVFETEVEID
ncbi:winged helix-turn-helix domain-containing protein [Bradyrhizobium cenepequi]|uniref:winged helix-turn-helix domain-containing protein n=1 Tax=Bradyrhizobium cenepequi TaxID=2821403 RepID=UPI001CE37F3F|nr:winged helix-turn-helix domain-containing protein [Bradyrhizobium cenepequi]